MKKIILSTFFILIIGKIQAQANFGETSFFTYSGFICFVLTLIFLIAAYIWAKISISRDTNHIEVVTATPINPDTISPALLAYAHSKDSEKNTLGICLLDLAVKGFVQFEKKGYKILIKKLPKEDKNSLSKESTFVLDHIFQYSETINVDAQEAWIKNIYEELNHHIATTYNADAKSTYFFFKRIVWGGAIGLLLSYTLLFLFYPLTNPIYLIIGIVASLAVGFFSAIIIKAQIEDGGWGGKIFLGIGTLFYLMIGFIGIMAFKEEGRGLEFIMPWLMAGVVFLSIFLYDSVLYKFLSPNLKNIVSIAKNQQKVYIESFLANQSADVLPLIFALNANWNLKWAMEKKEMILTNTYDWLLIKQDEDYDEDRNIISNIEDILNDIKFNL